MKRAQLIIFLIVNLIAIDLYAQRSVVNRLDLDQWHPGTVFLKDGTRFDGQVNFNYLLDMVQVKTQRSVRAYNHKQLLEFVVFKEDENRQVTYKSLNLPIGDQIYEVVGEDSEKALLIASIVDTNTQYYQDYAPVWGPGGTRLGTAPIGPTQSFTVNRRAETFIIIDKTGRMDQIGTIVISRGQRQLKSTIRKKRLIAILERYKSNIGEYIEKNEINLRKRDQLIQTFLAILDNSDN